jgi:hypothetical protein
MNQPQAKPAQTVQDDGIEIISDSPLFPSSPVSPQGSRLPPAHLHWNEQQQRETAQSSRFKQQQQPLSASDDDDHSIRHGRPPLKNTTTPLRDSSWSPRPDDGMSSISLSSSKDASSDAHVSPRNSGPTQSATASGNRTDVERFRISHSPVIMHRDEWNHMGHDAPFEAIDIQPSAIQDMVIIYIALYRKCASLSGL